MPKPVGDFFNTLCSDTYLHSFTEPYTYQQLVDCYRMRLEDDSNYVNQKRGLYAGNNPVEDFHRFLDLAESRIGLLPRWWTVEKRNACELMVLDDTQWASVVRTVSKATIIEHYQDRVMPMQLRLLAEKIYGEKIDMRF